MYVAFVHTCMWLDRYVLLSLAGPVNSPYAGGQFFIEIFFDAEHPEVFPRFRFATPIRNPFVDKVGRIDFAKLETSPKETTCVDIVNFISDKIMCTTFDTEEMAKLATEYTFEHAVKKEEDAATLNDPRRNFNISRIAERLGVEDEDLDEHKLFYARIIQDDDKVKSPVPGFTPFIKENNKTTPSSAAADEDGGKSSILGKWSKGAQVDDDVGNDDNTVQFSTTNQSSVPTNLWAIRTSKTSAPLNFSEHSFLTLSHAISHNTLNAIVKSMGFVRMTLEQCQMLPAVMEGKDILVRSNTGTGKTISFLIPCIERAITFKRQNAVSALIVSPTRELASQIAETAAQLVVYHDGIVIDIFMGGKNINSEVTRYEERFPSILIVTPGRMLDHLERDTGKLEVQLSNLNTLVLDESDQLLAAGFLPTIETIIQCIPMSSPDLQTMMFSATVPPSLHDVVSQTLKNDGYFLDTDDQKKEKWGISQFNQEKNTLLSNQGTLGGALDLSQPFGEALFVGTSGDGTRGNSPVPGAEGEGGTQITTGGTGTDGPQALSETNFAINLRHVVGNSIVQLHVITEIEQQALMLKRILGLATARKDYKVIVFFQTARATAYFVSVMTDFHKVDVLEMHSRKSQPHRAHVSQKFKSETDQILFTSDVSARGVDYPNVTCCIQMGLPQNVENYIHRCGRSGRGGNGGLSIVLLSDFESFFLQELHEQGIKVPKLEVQFKPAFLEKISIPQNIVLSNELLNRAKLHYQAWIGYYCSHVKRLNITKNDIVQLSIIHAHSVLMLKEIPAIKRSTAEKMNVVDVPGVIIEG